MLRSCAIKVLSYISEFTTDFYLFELKRRFVEPLKAHDANTTESVTFCFNSEVCGRLSLSHWFKARFVWTRWTLHRFYGKRNIYIGLSLRTLRSFLFGLFAQSGLCHVWRAQSCTDRFISTVFDLNWFGFRSKLFKKIVLKLHRKTLNFVCNRRDKETKNIFLRTITNFSKSLIFQSFLFTCCTR